MKAFVRKFLPQFLISWYHLLWAFWGAALYGFPSRKLIVIGITGTKGKTTTCNLIAQILNLSGFKTGMATTVNFRIGEKEWINATKQTMLGRFKLQQLLAQMLHEGCKYAVVETSSEGILQHRHRFIDYKVAVFTNLYPEHIERHGGFENYRAAKLKLFEKIARKKDGIGIYNLDDDNVKYFLQYPIPQKYGYTLRAGQGEHLQVVRIEGYKLSTGGTEFTIEGATFKTQLLGVFNIYNAVAAVCVALSQGIPMDMIKEALVQAKPTPGRLELVDAGQSFKIVVDYSYEPTSLENALQTLKIFNPKRIIVVFGSAAGGRDTWRRPVMGKVADKYADIIIVTTDDPYDEDPAKIVDDILQGVLENPQRILGQNVFRIVDRREGIRKALSLASENDVVLIAGKGGEVWMNVAHGKKIPWDDREVVREEMQARRMDT